MDENLLKIFRPEAKEYLQKLNENLLILEKEPDNGEVLEELLRVTHSLKGTAAMVGFAEIAELAHKAEDVLNAVQEHGVEDMSEITPALFLSFDTIEQILGGEETDIDDIVGDLKEIASLISGDGGSGEAEDDTGKGEKGKEPDKAKKEEPQQEEEEEEEEKEEERAEKPRKRNPSKPPDSRKPGKQRGKKPGGRLKTKNPTLDIDDTVRVSVEKVNELMNLVGEMVLSWQKFQNYSTDLRVAISSITSCQIPEITQRQDRLKNLSKDYKENTKVLDTTLNQLQDIVMGIRMLPVSTVFALLPRVVHDVALEFNKKVEVEIKGEGTEIDKRMIEHLKDPLVHIIRNAVYHGIESPEERKEKGKPETGKIILSAYQQGDRVFIEVKDDGGGIDPEKIREASVKKGFFERSEAENLGRDELLQLIFNTGFSSREEADSISGRGVGLDVVKKIIEENLVGQVMIDTEPGKGTTFTLILPLTLLINSGLLAEVGDQTFVFLVNAVETVAYILPDEIKSMEGEFAVKIRDYTVPILPLDEVLGIRNNGSGVLQQEEIPVIVVNYAGQKLAFAVSRLLRQKDIVIKTLHQPVGKLKNVAGVTILENGLPTVILHIPDLIEAARKRTFSASRVSTVREKKEETGTEKKRIMLAEDSATTRDLEKSILESSGYLVDAESDGAKAYKRLTGSPADTYDLVFTDVNMPNMDGHQLCRRIRQNEQIRHLPIVIVSSLDSDKDKRKGLEAGADAYMTKSEFNQKDIVGIIERLIGTDG